MYEEEEPAVWNYITGTIIAAAWPLSTIGLYGTGNTLFPNRPVGSSWLELVAVVWFFALPYAGVLWQALED